MDMSVVCADPMNDKLVHVVVEAQTPHVEDVRAEDQIKVGQWYWVKEDDGKWFGCSTRIGSNYVLIDGPTHAETRIHIDEFFERCEFVSNPNEVIEAKVAKHQTKTHLLMGKVREITDRLAITSGLALPAASEAQALTVYGAGNAVGEYKTALEKAKEETLPQLFEQIKKSNKKLGQWLSASLIPLQAQADQMEPAIEAIKNRIFSVELYAGLVEKVEQFADGVPAPLNAKLHLMQRRAYMDEECLARYEVGGMEFADIHAFDAWLARPENRDRILSFPRTIVAFQVRRNRKDRKIINLSDFLQIMTLEEADKFTYLYIRNGERLYRLSTQIHFDQKLFPDMDHNKLSGILYARICTFSVDKMISEGEYLQKVAEDAAAQKIYDEAPEDDKWRHHHFSDLKDYHRYDTNSIYYDDIHKFVQDKLTKHNRLVLVLQGLLDRSPVLHPHPAWSIWTPNGFSEAIELVYDDSRALSAGDKPDFEAYRARLNASLQDGSITIGQEDAWERVEAIKESNRLDNDYRTRSSYRPSRFRPHGNPGPGLLARVAKWSPRKQSCTFEWDRKRLSGEIKEPIRCHIEVKASNLLNVSAYKAGDFRKFFDDPRTREEYLRWAPLLLNAEEHLAGNRNVREVPPPRKRRKTEDGSYKYKLRKEHRSHLGKKVELKYDIKTVSGLVHKKGSIWLCDSYQGGKFYLVGLDENGKKDNRRISHINRYDFEDAL